MWVCVGKDFVEAKNFNERFETGGYFEFFYKVLFWISFVVGGFFVFSLFLLLVIVNEMELSL